MKKSLALALALAACFSALPALAQNGRVGEAETYDFTDPDLVTGSLRGPDGDSVRNYRRLGRRSLIRARSHFVSELVHSVERL